MAYAKIAQIVHATQELNSELTQLNTHITDAWRCLAKVSERLYELMELRDQLSRDIFQDEEYNSYSWQGGKKYH